MDSQVQVQKVACASCGASISVPDDVDRLNCSYCGSQLVIKRGDGYVASKLAEQVKADIREVGNALGAKLDNIQNALEIDGTSTGVKCQKCGRADSVNKVTAVVRAGTTTINVTGKDQIQQTELARSLTLPKLQLDTKAGIDSHSLGFIAFVPGLVSGLIWAALSHESPLSTVFGMWMIWGMVLWAVNAHMRKRIIKDRKARLEAQTQRMAEVYERLHYCARCDGFFTDGEPAIHSPSELRQYLETVTSSDK